jgi:uncharacterized membrane protein (UPF0127 family)
LLLSAAVLPAATGCESASPAGGADIVRNDLAAMPTARMTVDGTEFEVWLALTPQEQALGLMHVEAAELAPNSDGAPRGMLFVFTDEADRSFWMANTPTALDVAFMRADGVIVSIHTMAPFDRSGYPSGAPAQYALEVLAETFNGLGIAEGDRASLP